MNPFEVNKPILIFVAGKPDATDYENSKADIALANTMRELGLDPIECIRHVDGTSLAAYAYSDTPESCNATIRLVFEYGGWTEAKLIKTNRIIEDADDPMRIPLGRVASVKGERAMDYAEWFYVSNNDKYYAVIPAED